MRVLLVALFAAAALAQNAAPAFEVASVKAIQPVNGMITVGNRTVPVGSYHYIQLGPRNLTPRISGNRLTIPQSTLPSLVMDAFNVRPEEFSGLPDWVGDSDLYTVTAKAPGDGPLEQDRARLMLQALLAERFGMKAHRETRNLPVYELSIAKGGTKLKEAAEGDRDAAPLGLIVSILENFLDHQVVDKTGLTGSRYKMEWDQTELLTELQQGKPAPSIFHEAEAQLGLSLKAAKQTTQFLVIDQVEKLKEN